MDVRRHRWTRDEVERMAEAGIFHPEARVELVNGEVVELSPQNSKHAAGVRLVEEALRACFSLGFDVRSQLPLAISKDDLLEPDVAVVTGHPRDYSDAHPSSAVLVVEVAASSGEYDRQRKLPRYALAGIQEYWILDVENRRLEIYRDPHQETYESRQSINEDGSATTLAQPDHPIALVDLLP